MNASIADDSIVHASLWMLLVLAVGVVLLMVVFAVVCRCGKFCSRAMTKRLDTQSNIRPQI